MHFIDFFMLKSYNLSCKYELCLEATEEYMRKAHKTWFDKGSDPSYSQQAANGEGDICMTELYRSIVILKASVITSELQWGTQS